MSQLISALLTVAMISLFSSISGAASSSGHDSNEIPGFVLWQFVNLIILGGLLYKYGKKPVADFFAARQSEYLKQAEKSKVLFQLAEKEYADIKSRLEHLKQTAESSVQKAKQDAEDIKKQMVEEARSTAARMKEETQVMAKLEAQRTNLKAKNELVLQVLSSARQVLTSDVASQDHQKLQADFNKNLEAVSP